MKAPRILGLILARGGSKRLPGKNIRPLAGKPLLAWSIEAARACAEIADVVVSTDDEAIAAVARAHGARVPFLRPPALAADTSTSADAALHALAFLREQEGAQFDAVLLLEPTSPLRASSDLPGVARLLAQHWDDTDAVVTVGRVHLEQPGVMKRMDAHGCLTPWVAGNASGEEPAWFPYGVAYAVKTEALERHRTFYPPRVLGYTIERWQNYEVDDLFDFLCVEAVMQHFKGKLP
ncbi:acylneuraminate cytidylyltransferase family protein [Ramlibacter ginsenosidimutans]|uniref:Acylneuraminate cytidylyltransferase family protein n=1 Tax=Ramlibacter ginsenosidimutans TaxID=502333 RepID=A0A934TWQ4_9BURK|nr:acylneuraminate cytidylyltransferase family protein [Ramlibacter ginsenosidimutans]MBK6008032.1 acylneuraminate cytidylyltransferase family protein [Ramlibacter ginsenosidimutans]